MLEKIKEHEISYDENNIRDFVDLYIQTTRENKEEFTETFAGTRWINLQFYFAIQIIVYSKSLNGSNIEEKIGKPSETDLIKSKISSKTSRGKKEAQKDAIKDTTSDARGTAISHTGGQPASLAFNIYFYLFLYLYIT